VRRFASLAWKHTAPEDKVKFGTDKRALVGGVGTDLKDLEAVAYRGNIREQFAFLHNGMVSRLFEKTMGHKISLPMELDEVKMAWTTRLELVVLEPGHTISMEAVPLSDRERVWSENGRLWRSGEQHYSMDFYPRTLGEEFKKLFDAGPHPVGQATGALIRTGISGHTWLLLDYAEAANRVWDAGLDLRWMRLALAGTMLSGGDHTLDEILEAADRWARDVKRPELGFEYSNRFMVGGLKGNGEVVDDAWRGYNNPGRYRILAPLTERELREHVALGGLFPDELVRGPGPAVYDCACRKLVHACGLGVLPLARWCNADALQRAMRSC
jgi:hypothetical protein